MREVVRSPAAQRDIDEILTWLDEHTPAAADRFAEAFDACCRLLTSHPFTGRVRADLSPGLRSVVVEAYVVFFEPADDRVVVHRVIHGARNITPALFGEE